MAARRGIRWVLALLLAGCGAGGSGTGDPATLPDLPDDAWADAAPDLPGDITAPDAPADAPPDQAPDAPADALPDAPPDAPGDLPDLPDAPDVPPPDGPWAPLCRSCEADGDCGAGGRCLTFTYLAQRFCALPCATDACPVGYACTDVSGTALCVPELPDCTAASWGLPCNGTDLAGLCKDGFGACTSRTATPGLCTAPCATDADCPAGLATCVPATGLCRAAFLDGSEACVESADESCPCAVPADTLLDDGLEALGLTRCTAVFPRSHLRLWPRNLAYDDWRLSRYAAYHDEPVAVPARLEHDLGSLDAPPGPGGVVTALAEALRALDRPWTGPGPGSPPSADLPAAVHAFVTAAGGTAEPADLAAALAPLPAPLAASLAPVVDALAGVVRARAAIDARLGSRAVEQMLFDGAHGFAILPASLVALPVANPLVRDPLAGSFEVERLYAAAMTLATAVRDAGLAAHAGTVFPAVRIETPAGALLFRGAGDDTYDPADLPGGLALVVDTGGHDTYRVPAGATASLDNPVSLLLDLSGDDDYGYVESFPAPDPALLPADDHGRYAPSAGPDRDNGPVSLSEHSRQGAGRLGVGMLYDLGAGRDTYRSLRLSQGCGVLGVGVLYDDGGADDFQAEAASQGFGMFGIGLLLSDADGSCRGADCHRDTYRGVNLVQGAAYARGFGLLLDAAGDDVYTALRGDPADGGTPLYFSPQNPGKSNNSMSQGCGFGRRADTDGVYMSGGIGILRDRGGADRYDADIFGQGVGYWFGTGVLADDGAGDDVYAGRWYVQGAAAHFAVGILRDGGGNDRYNPEDAFHPGAFDPAAWSPLNASQGCGHDFSLGMLLDRGGNDAYRAPGLSLGAGNDDGIGVFVDDGGDDAYDVRAGNTLGWGNPADAPPDDRRSGFLTWGLFLDGGGTDAYDWQGGPTPPPMQDGAAWPRSWEGTDRGPGRGAGIDGTGRATGL